VKKKYIQTELDLTSYSKLRNLSDLKAIPIKEAIRDAIREYISKREGEVEDDPVFSIVGALELDKDWSERKDWRP
jgi:hypothetical protein